MTNFSRIYATLLLLLLYSAVAIGQDKAAFVNPFTGTDKMGHTFPGACVPFGFVQLSPDTDTIPHNINGVYQRDAYKYCAGYQYEDKTIVGFSHTHLSGTGHSDLGDILVMPQTGELKLNPGTADNPDSGYRSRFSHETESARPGYYEVLLDDYGVDAQLTATQRSGVHRYTFPDKTNQRILIDLGHGIYNYDGKVLWANLRVENDTLLTGYRITNGWARVNYIYFAISFSKPIVSYGFQERSRPKYAGFWRKFDQQHNFPEMGGRNIISYFEFNPDESSVVEMRVSLSAVGTDGALKNMEAEVNGRSFDQIVEDAYRKWNNELSAVEVAGDKDKVGMFYTSLYHTMINPSIYMDVDGRYRGIDHQIHKAEGFTNYTVFSLWDTYRALHPLFNVINRDRNSDMVESMLAHYDQSVHNALPVWSHMGNENWCMIGYHGVSVVADALSKGLVKDKERAFAAMYSSSNVPYYDNTADYKELGYVPFDKNGNGSSITLEYAYDDWTIYNNAIALGKEDIANQYRRRASNYKNVFKDGFVHARSSNGTWKEPFSLLNTHGEGFIEGNSWNYSFYVPHDVDGMIREMGGDKKFIERLDSLFTMQLPDEFFENTEDISREGIIGNYVHGNEPSHHIPYLYAWSSQPWKGEYWIRQIMDRMYRNAVDGLCGNDDCGQMSAWYIFSAMGFYPVAPGGDQYILGAPYFPYMKVKMGDGKYLEITAQNLSDANLYVKSVKLNGKPHTKAYITYDDIKDGGQLTFEMASKPNKSRLFKGSDRPYSMQ